MMSQSVSQDRHITLDAMRGFAVMGILAMNIIAFAMPEWAYVTPLAYGGESLSDRIAWFLSAVFVDGKMRGLFSLLFGASLMLITERAEAKGASAARTHYARMAWLALFGLAHFYFIWFGDILFLYAMLGCVAFLFRHWEPARLIKWAIIIFLIGWLFWGLQFVGLQILQFFATRPDADASLVAQYREILNSPAFAMNVEADLALHRGGYAEIVASKLRDWSDPLFAILQGGHETLALMMVGMALLKNGFLTGQLEPEEYRRWVRRLLLPGLVLSALVAGWVAMMGFDLVTSLAAFLTWSAIPRMMLTIAYAALLLLLIRRMAGGALLGRVAAAGRVAFTNYLGTSIVMTTIFYGYGFGLYGDFGRAALWLFVITAWAVMLLWSKPWLDRFHYGPFEWLWRSLARAEVQRLRR